MLPLNTMGKKEKSSSSENKEMASLYADTACNKDAGISTLEGMYKLLEDENPVVIKVAATAGSKDTSEATLRDLACSFLHRIAARPRILPYTDMVRWVLDSTDISDRQFRTPSEELIGSFTIEDLRLMYKLPEPQATFNRQFMEEFAKEHSNLAECTKEWTKRSELLKKNRQGMYITGSLTSPYCVTAAMLCRLFGKPDINMILPEWLPLLNAAVNSTIADWAKILYDNLTTAIFHYRSK